MARLLLARLTRVLVLLLSYRIAPLSGLIGLTWFAFAKLEGWDPARLLLSIVPRRMVDVPWHGCVRGRVLCLLLNRWLLWTRTTN